MCTVTYIPYNKGCYITSNRDEKAERPKAFTPEIGNINGASLLFPKDAAAGGSWIAINQNGNTGVLLNGAFEKHLSTPPYKKSRGLVFLDIISKQKPFNYFQEINLQNIEPFTLILIDTGNLFECRWDGQNKHSVELDKRQCYIWSSATLYTPATIIERKKWFSKWLINNCNPTNEEILKFHHFAGDGDIENNVRMNREGKMLTVSITGINSTLASATMQHIDLLDGIITRKQLNFETKLLLSK